MKLIGLRGAASTNPALRRILEDLERWTDGVEQFTGFSPTGSQQAGSKNRLTPPSSPTLEADGADGHFSIEIGPADANANAFLIYQVQTSSTVPFETSTDVSTFDVGGAAKLDLVDPGKTKYVRGRSRFANSEWSGWAFISGTVSSGLLRTSSQSQLSTIGLGQVDNNLVFRYTLTQSGTSLTISVSASFKIIGETIIGYAAGSVAVSQYGVWHVYASDPNKMGGTVTYIATQDPVDVLGSDGNVYFGSLMVSASGGGAAQGSAEGIASTVLVLMFDLTTKAASAVVVGDSLRGPDGQAEVVTSIDTFENQPAVTFTSVSGEISTAGSRQIVLQGDGGWKRAIQFNQNDTILVRTDSTNQSGDIASLQIVVATLYRFHLSRTQTFSAGGLWFMSGTAIIAQEGDISPALGI